MRIFKGLELGAILFLGTVTAALFSALFVLYNMPIEGVLYGWLLFGYFTCVWIAIVTIRKQRQLRDLDRGLIDSKAGQYQTLPEATTAEAACFRAHLLELGATALKRENEGQNQKVQRQDSVTLWVHQIKTPIAAMRLLLEQKEEGIPSEQLAMELYKIEQYVDLALHMDRLESPTSDLLLAPLQVGAVVKATLRKLRMLFIGKGLSIDLSLPEEMPAVISDEKWLMVAIEQIISNAIKYTNRGGIAISLEGPHTSAYLPARVQHWNRGISLKIADTGIGIAEEDLPRVFEKGYTGYHGRFDKRATGLGLYLTQKSLDIIGAGITIDSKIGIGTEVTLWFKLDPI